MISVVVMTEGTGGMAALLKLEQANGSVERIPSDTRWQASASEDAGFTSAVVIAELGPKPIADPWPPQPASYFRKTFTAKYAIQRARLYVTALGSYRAFVNGQRVGKDILTPGWTDYTKRIQYQTYDITSLMKKGSNAVGAVVGDSWYASGLGWKLQRYLFGPAPLRLLLQIALTFKDGSQQTISTDESWQSAIGPILNDELYAGETYDARKAVPFSSVGFRPPSSDHSSRPSSGNAARGNLPKWAQHRRACSSRSAIRRFRRSRRSRQRP